MERSGMVEGAHGPSGGEVGPLHHPTGGPPPRAGEDFKKSCHSAASSVSARPWTISSEQSRIVGLARQIALVR